MAQKIDIQFTCDIPAHRRKLDASQDVETLNFSMDGRGYEIDLCPQHRSELADNLGLFERHGRKVRPGRKVRRVNDSHQSADIREWARHHGYDVSDRGRISADVIEDYEAAH